MSTGPTTNDPDDLVAQFRAAQPDLCDRCGPMPLWRSAPGPADVLVRIRLMLALVAQGILTEVPPPAATNLVAWSSVDPARITVNVIGHGSGPELPIDSALTVGCELRPSVLPELVAGSGLCAVDGHLVLTAGQ